MVSFPARPIDFKKAIFGRGKATTAIQQKSHVDQTLTLQQYGQKIHNRGSRRTKFGCGSIIATIIIALVIGLCGGFKSCKEDKTESRREPDGTTATFGIKVQSPPLCPEKVASECLRTDFNHRIQAAEKPGRTYNGNIR